MEKQQHEFTPTSNRDMGNTRQDKTTQQPIPLSVFKSKKKRPYMGGFKIMTHKYYGKEYKPYYFHSLTRYYT